MILSGFLRPADRDVEVAGLRSLSTIATNRRSWPLTDLLQGLE